MDLPYDQLPAQPRYHEGRRAIPGDGGRGTAAKSWRAILVMNRARRPGANQHPPTRAPCGIANTVCDSVGWESWNAKLVGLRPSHNVRSKSIQGGTSLRPGSICAKVNRLKDYAIDSPSFGFE
jgi:hypothetical protein